MIKLKIDHIKVEVIISESQIKNNTIFDLFWFYSSFKEKLVQKLRKNILNIRA